MGLTMYMLHMIAFLKVFFRCIMKWINLKENLCLYIQTNYYLFIFCHTTAIMRISIYITFICYITSMFWVNNCLLYSFVYSIFVSLQKSLSIKKFFPHVCQTRLVETVRYINFFINRYSNFLSGNFLKPIISLKII